jgi:hypothetical protein
MTNFKKTISVFLSTLVVIAASGCASVQMASPTSDIATIEILRTAKLEPASVGTFTLAPGKDPAMDKTLGGLRGSSVAPANGSFAAQLKEQIVADLKASNIFSEASKIVISGQLTDSQVDAGMSVGKGRLAAIFFVDREGKRVFQKELAIDEQWQSSFVGASAIPDAIYRYTSMYKSLSQKLFEDPDFRAGVK